MAEHNDDERDRMLEIIRLQAEALARRAKGRKNSKRHAEQPATTPPRRHQPQDEQLREWSSTRSYFQHLEADVREALELKPEDRVTREMLHNAGGPSPRTTRRIMVETHGMVGDEWPPSTWPEQLPN